MPSQKELIHQHAKGENIDSIVKGRLVLELLGSHVPHRPFDHSRGRLVDAVASPSNAEVDELDRAGLADEHIGGCDVAMHDFAGTSVLIAMAVDLGQGLGKGQRDEERFSPWDDVPTFRLEPQQLGEARTVNVLEGDIGLISDGSSRVDQR